MEQGATPEGASVWSDCYVADHITKKALSEGPGDGGASPNGSVGPSDKTFFVRPPTDTKAIDVRS